MHEISVEKYDKIVVYHRMDLLHLCQHREKLAFEILIADLVRTAIRLTFQHNQVKSLTQDLGNELGGQYPRQVQHTSQ